jgi:hypothetical protein
VICNADLYENENTTRNEFVESITELHIKITNFNYILGEYVKLLSILMKALYERKYRILLTMAVKVANSAISRTQITTWKESYGGQN